MLRLLKNYRFPGARDHELQLQPAGFDLSAASIARFTTSGALDFTNKQRQLPDISVIPWPASGDEALLLEPGGYLVAYNEQITVPHDAAGIVLPRSSLLRCGATLHSALWDPGYSGQGQGLLTLHAPLRLFKDARIGQFILISLETAAEFLYHGQYQNEGGLV